MAILLSFKMSSLDGLQESDTGILLMITRGLGYVSLSCRSFAIFADRIIAIKELLTLYASLIGIS